MPPKRTIRRRPAAKKTAVRKPAKKKAAKKRKRTRSSISDTVPSQARMSARERRRQDEYETESALETLKRADDIRRDSGRMKKIQALARKQMKAASKFAGPSE